MRIAVISDTHDHYPDKLPGLLKGADEIWHLGDVMAPEILSEFQALGCPLRVVMGNCDCNPAWPHSLNIEKEGVRFHLIHIPPGRTPPGAQVILHGHTHIPRDYLDSLGVRWLNPGSVSQPRAGFPASFAWLEVNKGRIDRWQLVKV
jgi:putative phosphoesterase